jgi:hypothetical protein
MRRTKFTEVRERQLLDPNEDPVNRANAIACMQADGVVRHEELIASFVDHQSPHLRSAAIKMLLRWDRFGYLPLALDLLKNDPERVVRGTMTQAIAYVAHVGQHFDEIARALVAAIENDPDPGVARYAYQAARVIIVPENWLDTRVNDENFDRQRDVDWNLLAPYRAPASSQRTSSN